MSCSHSSRLKPTDHCMQTWPERKFAVIFLSVEKPLKRTRETEKRKQNRVKIDGGRW